MNWKKAIIIALDIAIGIYLVLAVTAFNKPDDEAMVCNEVRIDIEKTDFEGFLTKDDISQLLRQKGLYPVGKPMKQVSARQIEETLRANALIEHAECYKTQTGHVRIDLRQRIPVVRVMADNGANYYVDSHGEILPPAQYTCDVIVATGHISQAYAKRHLATMVNTILSNKFWMNQVVQLNVLNDGSVEIVPRVGEHIAYIGQPKGLERKLERLLKFYRYGLSETGWNKYARVSVEFDNQIICKRR